jgi:hypothetical protein
LISYDYDEEQLPGRPRYVRDHRPLLAAAGFQVLVYDETPQWRDRLRGIYRFLASRIPERARELDLDPDQVRCDLELTTEGVELMTHA